MENAEKKKKWGGLLTVIFLVWFVINIRVAAGIGSIFERALDGLVGIAFLVGVVFWVLGVFQLEGNQQR